jgi:hypothetical protein
MRYILQKEYLSIFLVSYGPDLHDFLALILCEASTAMADLALIAAVPFLDLLTVALTLPAFPTRSNHNTQLRFGLEVDVRSIQYVAFNFIGCDSGLIIPATTGRNSVV